MATFQITDPNTGRSIRLTGDSPPTEQELEQIFSTLPSLQLDYLYLVANIAYIWSQAWD